MLNVIFGILPTLATVLVATLTENSSEWLQWLSIVSLTKSSTRRFSDNRVQVPLGFGNSVVLQTTLIALLASVNSKNALFVGSIR